MAYAKRTFTKGFYKNRLPIGKWEYYQYYSDENNKVQSSLLISNYKNGLKDGEEIRINEHNRITNKTLYKRGLKNGKSNSFNKDGTVWESGKYKNGKKIGDWLIYHDNGNVEYFYRYDSEGRKIYDEKRSENGELIYYHITRYTRKFKYSDLYENGKLVKKYKFKIRKNS